jgi:hypothetical protein
MTAVICLASPEEASPPVETHTPLGEPVHNPLSEQAVQYELYFMEVTMRRISILLLVFLTCFVLGTSAQKSKIITFDAPGAGSGAGQGTIALGSDAQGVITGWYVDGSNVYHGFLRAPNGDIATIDVAGAGTSAGQGTFIGGMNLEGIATGFFVDAGNVDHGFLRTPDGTVTTIDVADAGTGAGQGTSANTINAAGEAVGIYIDSNGVWHGFLRTP